MKTKKNEEKKKLQPFEIGELDQYLFGQGTHYEIYNCLLYTSPSPRDRQKSRMPSSA